MKGGWTEMYFWLLRCKKKWAKKTGPKWAKVGGKGQTEIKNPISSQSAFFGGILQFELFGTQFDL